LSRPYNEIEQIPEKLDGGDNERARRKIRMSEREREEN
jgi:hypothetical protein